MRTHKYERDKGTYSVRNWIRSWPNNFGRRHIGGQIEVEVTPFEGQQFVKGHSESTQITDVPGFRVMSLRGWVQEQVVDRFVVLFDHFHGKVRVDRVAEHLKMENYQLVLTGTKPINNKKIKKQDL